MNAHSNSDAVPFSLGAAETKSLAAHGASLVRMRDKLVIPPPIPPANTHERKVKPMILDENYWALRPDLETYALEHPMIPLGEAARDADYLATKKKPASRARPAPQPLIPSPSRRGTGERQTGTVRPRPDELTRRFNAVTSGAPALMNTGFQPGEHHHHAGNAIP